MQNYVFYHLLYYYCMIVCNYRITDGPLETSVMYFINTTVLILLLLLHNQPVFHSPNRYKKNIFFKYYDTKFSSKPEMSYKTIQVMQFTQKLSMATHDITKIEQKCVLLYFPDLLNAKGLCCLELPLSKKIIP